MPNYVCFNLSHFKSSQLEKLSPNFWKMELVDARETGIKEGDKCIFCQKKSYSDFIFLEYGRIKEVKPKSKSEKEFKYSLSIEIEGKSAKDNSLLDYIYSLKVVYNFNEPYRHFTRYYRYLPKNDYETLVKGNIYIARTVFGHIFNALPEYHQIQIISEIINSQGMDFFNNRDYHKALELLRSYVENTIEEAGNYLIASKQLLSDILGDSAIIMNIGFLAAEENKADNLVNQVENFEKLFQTKEEFKTWANIENAIMEYQEIQNTFDKSFADVNWPITRGGV